MYLLTGATGFIGKHIVQGLLASGASVVVATRQMPERMEENNINCMSHIVGEINSETNWQPLVQGVDTVVHCAGRDARAGH
jgi:nucleoside-diphosphate-sugar epimerase